MYYRLTKWLLLSTLISASLFAAACTPLDATNSSGTSETAAADDGPIPIALGVGFIPNVQFANYYVGIEKGFYADEGLDVTMDYGFENDYLALVGANEFQFMVGSGDQVVIGRAQGLPVTYIMNWYTQYPVVVMAKADAGISEPEDLAGKTIGLPGPFGANYVAFRGILEAAGLTEADVQMESIGFTQAAAVSEETVDAAVDYGVNGPVVLAQEGIETVQIKLDKYLMIPANGLVTNETTIQENPELVSKMVRASLKAIQYTLDNPDEAFEIALIHVPEAADNLDANRAVFDAVLDYWTPQGDYQLGETRLPEWEAAAEFMARIGLVDTVVAADELFTVDFLE